MYRLHSLHRMRHPQQLGSPNQGGSTTAMKPDEGGGGRGGGLMRATTSSSSITTNTTISTDGDHKMTSESHRVHRFSAMVSPIISEEFCDGVSFCSDSTEDEAEDHRHQPDDNTIFVDNDDNDDEDDIDNEELYTFPTKDNLEPLPPPSSLQVEEDITNRTKTNVELFPESEITSLFLDQVQVVVNDDQHEGGQNVHTAEVVLQPECLTTTTASSSSSSLDVASPDPSWFSRTFSSSGQWPSLPKFCKVQEPESHDPPRFRLIPVADFLVFHYTTNDQKNHEGGDASGSKETPPKQLSIPEPEVSLERLMRIVLNASSPRTEVGTDLSTTTTTTTTWSLQYQDARGDVVTVSSSAVLHQALEDHHHQGGDETLRFWVRRDTAIQPWPTSVCIRLVPQWEENLETTFLSCRLMDRTIEQPPRFATLQAIASQQFNLPTLCMAFNIRASRVQGNNSGSTSSDSRVHRSTKGEDDSKVEDTKHHNAKKKKSLWMMMRPHRITCDEDLVDALWGVARSVVHDDGQATLYIAVELVLATVTRICYPTVANDTMSRRIPLQSLVDKKGQLRFEKILEDVADSLDTEEFVLTYSTPTTNDDDDGNDGRSDYKRKVVTTSQSKQDAIKYFITCPEDLLDAMRLFPGGELILCPQLPHETVLTENGSNEVGGTNRKERPLSTPDRFVVRRRRSELPGITSHQESCDERRLRLLFQGHEGASVLIPLNSILDETGNASYWKLVGFAVKLFHLGKTNDGMPPPICLFYMHQKGDGAKNQITSDVVLTALIQRDSGIGSIDNEHLIHVEPVAFALTKSSNGLSTRRFSLSHISSADGTGVSFRKLVLLSRATDPAISLFYFDRGGNKKNFASDNDLADAFQEFPSGDLLIRSNNQCDPYILHVRDAFLAGKKCKLNSSHVRPSIMFRSETATACWNLSDVLQGRYRLSATYWRDTYIGSVQLRVGVVLGTDGKKVVRKLAADHHFSDQVLSTITLSGAVLAETEIDKPKGFGEIKVRPNTAKEGEASFLVVSAAMPGTQKAKGGEGGYHDLCVSNMELVYLGPVEIV